MPSFCNPATFPGSTVEPKKLPPATILPAPAVRPVIIPDFNESFKPLPAIKLPAVLPNPAAKARGIVGSKIGAAIASTTGATFLTTFLTVLTTFLKTFFSFLRKNSGCPVSGFKEFNSLPTIYLSGSKPISSIWV